MKNIIYFGSEAEKLEQYLKSRECTPNNHLVIQDMSLNEPESIETHFVNNPIVVPDNHSDATWGILVAGNAINFGVLASLENLANKPIDIFYLIPDLTFFDDFAKQNHKIVYNVLQEYSRSGKFRSMVLIDFLEIEKTLDNLSFSNYDSVVFDTVAYVMLTNDEISKMTPQISTVKEEDEASRIVTFGIVDLTSKKEKVFFDLKYPKEIIYKYLVDSSYLKSNAFRKEILSFLKMKCTTETKVMYEVFDVENQNICLMVRKSKVIQ